MPFKSEAQRRLMWAKHPEIAKRWSAEGKGKVYGTPPKSNKGGTFANNTPVGSAGQPQNGKMSMPESKSSAISRRLKKMSDMKKGK